MNTKDIGKVITSLSPLSLIINNKEDILWISDNLKKMIGINLNDKLKLKDILGYNRKDIKLNNKVILNNRYYSLSKIDIKEKDIIIITLELVNDYKNPEVKLFVYEEIINNLNDGVLLTDDEGKIILYNKAMEELEKLKASDMIGKKIWEAYGYNDKNKSEHMQVYENGVPILDKYKAHAYNNGNPIYKSYSTIPIKKQKETIGVYTISKNETRLRSLLSEIVELKRQFNDEEFNNHDGYNNGTRYTFTDIVGTSKNTKKVIKESQAISWLDNSVLLVGDTGTGKEVFAQSIHNYGKRRYEPFIAINCSAIPENLLESILFGSVKGAYTGAVDSVGLFEEAGNGTLFLDE